MGKKKPSQAAALVPAAVQPQPKPKKEGATLKAPAGVQKPSPKTSTKDKQAPKKAAINEIDDIFTSGKGKKAAQGAVAAAAEATAALQSKSKASQPSKVEGSKDDLFGADVGKGRKKTEEGWNVYTEDELGLAKGGGGDTDLCPFDCQCCF